MPYDPTDRIGKISGPMLKDNLVRDGIDLAFETDLLYIDSTTQGIGIKTDTVNKDLVINGFSKIPELLLTTGTATFGNVIFNTNGTISSTSGPVEISPQGASPTLTHDRIITDDYEINDNAITGLSENTNIILSSNGVGTVDFYSNKNINGTLYIRDDFDVTGNVNIKGTVIVGDGPLDTVTITPELDQNINPQTTGTYNLGLSTKRWQDAEIVSANATTLLTAGQLNVDSIRFDSNIVSSTTTDSDINLTPNGTGLIKFNNFGFSQDSITNDGTLGVTVDVLDYAELATALQGAITGNVRYSFFNTVLIGLRPLGDINGDGIVTLDDVTALTQFSSETLTDQEQIMWIQENIRPWIVARKGTYTELFYQINPFLIQSSGTGYVQFIGTEAVVLPSGPNIDRNYAEIGHTRWNTDLQRLECFDGEVYSLSTGGGELITPADMEELGNLYSLIFA